MNFQDIEKLLKEKIARRQLDETFWRLLYLFVQQDPEAPSTIKSMPYELFRIYLLAQMLWS